MAVVSEHYLKRQWGIYEINTLEFSESIIKELLAAEKVREYK